MGSDYGHFKQDYNQWTHQKTSPRNMRGFFSKRNIKPRATADSSPVIIQTQEDFGVKGYTLPKPPNLDVPKDFCLPNWKNQKMHKMPEGVRVG